MTRKLYYEDAYLFEFDARVLDCKENGGAFEVLLDATAFFPGGGGQPADKGVIAGARVTGMRETDADVFHICDAPLAAGSRVACAVERDFRLANMRRHTGEHIFTGVTHAETSLDNVGFHIGEDYVTVDFNGDIPPQTLSTIERLANETVMACKPVNAFFPSCDELENMAYRSKKEIGEGIRIVAIPACDACACCGIHVSTTGEVGMIKVLTCARYKSGVRILLKIAADALADYGERVQTVQAVSALLSAPPQQAAPAVEKLISERDALRRENLRWKLLAFERRIAGLSAENCFVFEENLEPAELSECCSMLCERAQVAGVFSGTDGEIRYCLGSNTTDVREFGRRLNDAFGGSGGGKPGRVQGRLNALRGQVEGFLRANACGSEVLFL